MIRDAIRLGSAAQSAELHGVPDRNAQSWVAQAAESGVLVDMADSLSKRSLHKAFALSEKLLDLLGKSVEEIKSAVEQARVLKVIADCISRLADGRERILAIAEQDRVCEPAPEVEGKGEKPDPRQHFKLLRSQG